MTKAGQPGDASHRLNNLLARAGECELNAELASRFELYLALLLRWNARLNLTAIRDPEEILSRHFVESILCARVIPAKVSSVLDFGSGAGFPGIPIALCRPEVSVTLAESQTKKAAFLREAVRTLSLNTLVYGHRAETLQAKYDGVVMRAVDKMEQAVATAAELVIPRGWLILMTTGRELAGLQEAAGPNFDWTQPVQPVSSEGRLIAMGVRES